MVERLLAIDADLVTHHPATSLLLDARHQRLGQLCEICCNVQRPRETERRTAKLEFLNKQREDRDLQEILELIFADSQLNIYAGELEVRPPAAPTTRGYSRRKAAAVRAGSERKKPS
jgi:hypothetical protein